MSKEEKQTNTPRYLKEREKFQEPYLYDVLLHNDDVTTMDFVVVLLMRIFHRPESDAISIMLKVHKEGVGIAGTYPYDIALTKCHHGRTFARANNFPLILTVEPSSSDQ